jgi:hypothetical protein
MLLDVVKVRYWDATGCYGDGRQALSPGRVAVAQASHAIDTPR